MSSEAGNGHDPEIDLATAADLHGGVWVGAAAIRGHLEVMEQARIDRARQASQEYAVHLKVQELRSEADRAHQDYVAAMGAKAWDEGAKAARRLARAVAHLTMLGFEDTPKEE